MAAVRTPLRAVLFAERFPAHDPRQIVRRRYIYLTLLTSHGVVLNFFDIVGAVEWFPDLPINGLMVSPAFLQRLRGSLMNLPDRNQPR